VAASTSRLILNAPSVLEEIQLFEGTSRLSSCRVKKQPLTRDTRVFEAIVVYNAVRESTSDWWPDGAVRGILLQSEAKRRKRRRSRDKLCVSTSCNVLPRDTASALARVCKWKYRWNYFPI